jgi:ribose transport system ATP-binding protein
MLALFGVLRGVEGTIRLAGEPYTATSPAHAKSAACGIALVPEDRKTEGLLLPMAVRDNLSLAALGGLGSLGIVDRDAENKAIDEMVRRLRIKIGDPGDAVGTLSGGNQQKVVLARWLATKCPILLLDEPTRGIDVGARQEIYQVLRELSRDGHALLVASSSLPELLALSDRIVVMRDGRVVGELAAAEATAEAVLQRAAR